MSLFKNTIEKIKSLGYEVYGLENTTYAFFTDGKNIGYFQESHFGTINFSTVHRPCRHAGTGFCIRHGIYCLEDITNELCQACFVNIPNEFKGTPRVYKWESWDDFMGKGWSNSRKPLPKY